LVEHIYYGNRFSQFGRNDIWLTEDDLDGDEGGEDDGLDNETFYMDLNKLPATCEKVAVFLCSFSGDDFGDVPHASVRLYEGTHDRPTNVLAQYNLASDPSFSGSVVMVMGVFYRHNGAWKFNAVGTPIGDRDARQAIESIKRTIL
jgi:tellurium resistance protein TerZ